MQPWTVLSSPDLSQPKRSHNTSVVAAGYDYPAICQRVEAHQDIPHIRRRGAEKQEKVFSLLTKKVIVYYIFSVSNHSHK